MIPLQEHLVHVRSVTPSPDGESLSVLYVEARTLNIFRQAFSRSAGACPKAGSDVYISVAEEGQVVGPWRALISSAS